MIKVLSKEEILNFINNHSRYQIAQATGISEQTLANYVKGRTDVAGMAFDKVIKITEYYNSFKKEGASQNMVNQQILIQNSTEQKITAFFNNYPFAVKLNWIKAHKEMFIVNFDIESNKTFKKYPYDLDNLYFFAQINKKEMEKFANHLRSFAEKIEFGGARVLYKLEDKTYQIVYKVNKPSAQTAITLLNIVETDVYKDELNPKLSEEESILTNEDLNIQRTIADEKNDKKFERQLDSE